MLYLVAPPGSKGLQTSKFSPQKLEEIDRTVEAKLFETDPRELRQAADKTQEELAEVYRRLSRRYHTGALARPGHDRARGARS